MRYKVATYISTNASVYNDDIQDACSIASEFVVGTRLYVG